MDQPVYDSLSRREKDCLRLVTREGDSAEIGVALNLTTATVETYIKRARAKLGGVSRYTAARELRLYEERHQSQGSLRQGLVPTPDMARSGGLSAMQRGAGSGGKAREPWSLATAKVASRPMVWIPLRDKTGTDNDIPFGNTIILIVLIAIAAMLAAAILLGAMTGFGAIIRH